MTRCDGFDVDIPAAVRWWTLAEWKRPEIDALIVRAHEMKRSADGGSGATVSAEGSR